MKLGARKEDLPKRELYKASHRGLASVTKVRFREGQRWGQGLELDEKAEFRL